MLLEQDNTRWLDDLQTMGFILSMRLKSLTLQNFRTFDHFEIEGLGLINLIVGTNNCGKTSVLEAINILTSRGKSESLRSVLTPRGEQIFIDSRRSRYVELDIRHLFHGHDLHPDASFSIRGENGNQSHQLTAKVIGRDPQKSVEEQPSLFEDMDEESDMAGDLALELLWDGNTPFTQQIPISRRGGLKIDAISRSIRTGEDVDSPVQLITTGALNRDQVVALFDAVVLTPEEEIVLDALRTIEPAIERIAPLSTERPFFRFDRGGMLVKLKNSKQRIPIGSMGDGIWRLLGIALALANTQGGVLLVDEIDTGLHYSVMDDMWRLVRTTAERLNVQVFATTHSRDCYESLASISSADVEVDTQVSIQRIDRGKQKAVAFSERDIVIAAERAIEVR